MTYAATSHTELIDDPPVASMPDGGPEEGPGLLVSPGKFQYEVVQGYFLQNGPERKSAEFHDMLKRSFGLVDTSQRRWHNLKDSIEKLQDEAPEGVQYKVFFLGRHGQGWHNYAVTQIGVEPWDDYWAFQYTNGTLTWGPDPELTELGIRQAKAIQRCWKEQAAAGAPISKDEMKWYVSPLTRTGQTMLYSWGDMLTGVPEVWEDWREQYGSHTCDKRSPRSYIEKRFPGFKIEEGLAEEDPLWRTDNRESNEEMQIRGQRALDRIFSEDGADETYISVTAHSGNLRNLLAVMGHQPYPLTTSEMIPVVLKATRLDSNGHGSNGHATNGHALNVTNGHV